MENKKWETGVVRMNKKKIRESVESCCRNAGGEMAGVTSPFFMTLIRDTCQCAVWRSGVG